MPDDGSSHEWQSQANRTDGWPDEWRPIVDNTSAEQGNFSRRSILKTGGAAAGIALGSSVLSSSRAAAEEVESSEPAYPSLAWYERELENYAMTLQAPREQATTAFQERLQRQSAANAATSLRQEAEEPAWRRAGNASLTWEETFAGDPFRYPSVDLFYRAASERTRIAFYDQEGARLNGRVWVPADSEPGDDLPGVVIVNGSLQETEPVYWWAAQTLVKNGYMVMTFDPRGQGRSDTITPGGEAGTNINPSVFVTNQIAAIDFLHSTPDDLYPHTDHFGDPNNPAPELPFNPYHDRLDRDRLGIAGHSAGALGVSIVQGLEPWPGLLDRGNPVDAVVAWDNLGNVEQIGDPRTALLTDLFFQTIGPDNTVEPRVPAMGLTGDYFVVPVPYLSPPAPEAKRLGYNDWQAAGIPAYQLVIRGGTHWDFANNPFLPATSWRPPNKQESGAEEPFGFGNALADYYTLAWFDRWLKQPGEQGYDTADERLLADETFVDRLSFYYQSARDFPDRQGTQHVTEDIRGDASGDDAPGLIGSLLDDADDDLASGILGDAYEDIDNIYDQVVEVDTIPTSINEISSSNELSPDIPDAAQRTPLVGSLQGLIALEDHLRRSDDPKADDLRREVTQLGHESEELITALFE
jgi:hypothetical protein